jgi:Ca2+-binding EF-hand superfamily protein
MEALDVNGDGKINARDVRLLLRYIAGLTDAGEVKEGAADFNGDGRINARDARTILRYIAGLE